VIKMSKTAVTVEFGKEELLYLINYLVEDLRVWSEKGFESKEEKEQFQNILSAVNKLREAIGENIVLFL
jgi:hypothetical protein